VIFPERRSACALSGQLRRLSSRDVTRRSAVVVVGAVLLVLFGLLGAAVPVPYIAEVPGPTFNTLGAIDGTPIISVEGRARNDVSGNLNLTTVSLRGGRHGISLVKAVTGWLDPETSVVPREAVFPPDQTTEETRQQGLDQFLTSEQKAEVVALSHLGYPDKVVVQGLSDDSPSQGKLQEGDAIEAVDGRPTPDSATLTTVLSSIPGGTPIEVSYTRLGQPGTASLTTKAAPGRAGSLLGVLVRDAPSAPFDVDIEVQNVGGPSAGLMLTLGVLDLVGDTDLTDGKVIAGTGTIDVDGTVGPIGGIALKMVSAHDIGAEVFLVPARNCAEALRSAQPGLPLAKVSTLDDALTALADVRDGRTPPSC
jgi:PDZ domain-containing protein